MSAREVDILRDALGLLHEIAADENAHITLSACERMRALLARAPMAGHARGGDMTLAQHLSEALNDLEAAREVVTRAQHMAAKASGPFIAATSAVAWDPPVATVRRLIQQIANDQHGERGQCRAEDCETCIHYVRMVLDSVWREGWIAGHQAPRLGP